MQVKEPTIVYRFIVGYGGQSVGHSSEGGMAKRDHEVVMGIRLEILQGGT